MKLGYIYPNKVHEEQIYTDADIYSYADPTGMNLEHIYSEADIYSYADPTGMDLEHIYTEPDDNMNQVQPQVGDEPSSPLAPSPSPSFLIPDLQTELKSVRCHNNDADYHWSVTI